MNLNQAVTDYIHKASTDQVEIMELLRDLIHQSVEGVSEEIKWGFPVFGKSGDFAYLRCAQNHITLGFYNIEKIEDPENRLEGSGKTLKHLKIRKKDEISNQLFTTWFRAISS